MGRSIWRWPKWTTECLRWLAGKAETKSVMVLVVVKMMVVVVMMLYPYV